MDKLHFDIYGEKSNLEISDTYEIDADGIEYITLKFKTTERTIFSPLTIKLFVPVLDIHYKWNSKIHLFKALNLDWFNNLNTCNGFTGAPVECLMSYNNENRFTVALSDTLNTIKFNSIICEETAQLEYSFKLFDDSYIERDYYDLTIRIDRRPIQYFKSLNSVTKWWETLNNNTPISVPNNAKEGMYSSWYSFHQLLDEKNLINQCILSKKLGLNSIIIDDGWQTSDNNRGYAYCGDWEVSPSKIKNMKNFVNNVHKEGVKILLWYSVPFIGKHSKKFKEFKDMLIDPKNKRDWYVLDPRYKEVREHIIGLYEKALLEWDLDGFKLDFVDEFVVTPFSGNSYDSRRDFSSITEATDKLLKDCIKRLKTIKSDIMIEFRQTYNGPIMRTYGNIFRAVDCPLNDLENHIRVSDIRLLSGTSAVHSDMIMWNRKDSVESAALQFINIMFSVPQISMLIDTLPEEHYKMIKFYLGLWNKYSDAFINGEFIPLNPHLNFNIVKGIFENTIVCTYHSNELLNIDKFYNTIVFINGTYSNDLHLLNETNTMTKKLTVYDCTGNIIFNKKIQIKSGYNKFTIPSCGVAEFK